MLQERKYSDDNELLLCFDEQGKSIESRPRGVVHTKPYYIWHGIVNIWVLSNKGEILCTHRAPHISGNPGKWQTYVGGHVKANSTFSETTLRELNEEIGIKITDQDLKLIEKGRREDTMHVYKSYATFFNEDLSKLNFSDGEVSEAQWLSLDQYQKLKEKNPDNWCNGIKLEQYQKALKILNIP